MSVSITRQSHPSIRSTARSKLPAIGTESHLRWIPVDGQLPTSDFGEYLSSRDWARDDSLDVPEQYKPAFERGMPGWVHREKVVEGWLEFGIIRRSLQILHTRIQLASSASSSSTAAATQLPKTLVVDHHFAERLFRQKNGVQKRGNLPHSPALKYCYQHGWRHFRNSNKTYPTARLEYITEAEVLTHDNIIFPFIDKSHFILVHVRVKEQRVRQLNSKLNCFMPTRDACLKHVARFMSDVQQTAGFPASEWVVEAQPVNLPQQLDGSSCGMFVIGYATQIFAHHYECDQIQQSHIRSLRVNVLEMLATDMPGPDYKH